MNIFNLKSLKDLAKQLFGVSIGYLQI